MRIHSAIPLLLAACCCSCGSSPRTAETAPSVFAVIKKSPATQPLRAADVLPLQPGSAKYAVLDDAGRITGSITIERKTTSDYHATIASAEGNDRVEYLVQDANGRITLTAVIERGDNALTLFEPPLVVAPATLKPGETFTSQSAMRVVALDNPKKQREHGTAKRTITYVGDAIIRTPLSGGGEMQVAQLDVHFTADLTMADADEHTTLYVSRDAGGGLIAEDSREKVTILAAFGRNSHRLIVRQ